jgi:superfamily II DNA or RNA helicase
MNLLENVTGEITLELFLETYGSRIIQDSEKLFLTDFLYPLLGEGIRYLVPQYPFIDSEGRNRKIDFALVKDHKKLALEVNGETYHAEGIIPNDMFDDNLFRQNEILSSGWSLLRFSYSQLQDPRWRIRVTESLHRLIARNIPELISESAITPHHIQQQALDALDFYRNKGWKKGIVILPPGLGKTYLSAFDAKRVTEKDQGRTLFIVHRLDILTQSKDAFERVWPDARTGLLTGEVKEHIHDSDILFASKDSLRNPDLLALLAPDEFGYIIVDEVHHGQAPTYQAILRHFAPKFLLGITATPDRMDRKDIFELFEYSNVFEYSINDAIENGFLVPFTYYGLKDNIDYSNIRYNGNKYNVQDLDRYLIIEKRNRQILNEYQEKGHGDKAIGFCTSIKHAERMTEFFNENGVSSVAITSHSDERDQKVKDFRNNIYAVAFTVDLFNEGMDFPNVRTLMFLRPTESKTIFMQQLGRGLRLSSGKDKVSILDFISNYRKANKIREYLSRSRTEKRTGSGRIEKYVYQYSPKNEIIFDAEVEEILDAQDRNERGVEKLDLIEAYYNLAEQLGRKPSQEDINQDCEFKVSQYIAAFGSWITFLRDQGEFTEASYHYPQGVHLGHILYVVKTIQENKVKDSHISESYVRMRGSFGTGRLGAFQRQTKYKLQALMEMGLIADDRNLGQDEDYELKLTPEGKALYIILKPILQRLDFSFSQGEDKIPSWEMNTEPHEFNIAIWDYIKPISDKREFVQKLFLKTHAVAQMLNYLYKIERKKETAKSEIYEGFFNAPFVKQYGDQVGIESATAEGARHRCPFLLNLLEAIGVISQTRRDISINFLLICRETMELKSKESEGEIEARGQSVSNVLAGKKADLTGEEISLLKEGFGANFLTPNYHLKDSHVLF